MRKLGRGHGLSLLARRFHERTRFERLTQRTWPGGMEFDFRLMQFQGHGEEHPKILF